MIMRDFVGELCAMNFYGLLGLDLFLDKILKSYDDGGDGNYGANDVEGDYKGDDAHEKVGGKMSF